MFPNFVRGILAHSRFLLVQLILMYLVRLVETLSFSQDETACALCKCHRRLDQQGSGLSLY